MAHSDSCWLHVRRSCEPDHQYLLDRLIGDQIMEPFATSQTPVSIEKIESA